MNAETSRTTAEAELRRLIESWRTAIVARDVPAIVAHYDPDIVAFDAIKALQFKGVDAYRRHWEACMEMCRGAVIFEIHELAVHTGDDVAFSHALTRCGETASEGKEASQWMRMTAGYRRLDGRWRIVHEHFSAPFDLDSLKILSLTP